MLTDDDFATLVRAVDPQLIRWMVIMGLSVVTPLLVAIDKASCTAKMGPV